MVRTPLLAATLLVALVVAAVAPLGVRAAFHYRPLPEPVTVEITNPAVDERGARYEATLRFIADSDGIWRLSLD